MFGPAARGHFFTYGLAVPACLVALCLVLLYLHAADSDLVGGMLKGVTILLVLLWLAILAGVGLLVLIDRLSRRRG